MIINQFRLMQADDTFDPTIPNWSRRYEWHYVLENLKPKAFGSIHNTCCGESAIHELFVNKLLAKFSLSTIYNSDVRISPINRNFVNFSHRDILEAYELYTTNTLCISTIEDFQHYGAVDKALHNLINYTKDRLIITADYPQLPEEWIIRSLGLTQGFQKGSNPLNGSNSSYPQHEFKHINILLLDISL